MKAKLVSEIPLLIIVLLPFLYLWYLWPDLPERVPLHWNLKGEIDRYGSKNELILIPFILPMLMYGLTSVIPFIDPKRKLQEMGNKYTTFRYILIIFVTVIAIYILSTAKSQSLAGPDFIFLMVGALFVVLGNYFQTLRPNYFIGIRTPWTLESETVWKKTHRTSGRIWLIGGILLIISSLLIPTQKNIIVFVIITTILTLASIILSYKYYKEETP